MQTTRERDANGSANILLRTITALMEYVGRNEPTRGIILPVIPEMLRDAVGEPGMTGR